MDLRSYGFLNRWWFLRSLFLEELENLKEEKKNLQQTVSEYEITLDDMGSKIRQ